MRLLWLRLHSRDVFTEAELRVALRSPEPFYMEAR